MPRVTVHNGAFLLRFLFQNMPGWTVVQVEGLGVFFISHPDLQVTPSFLDLLEGHAFFPLDPDPSCGSNTLAFVPDHPFKAYN